eukprot:gene28982-35947_t
MGKHGSFQRMDPEPVEQISESQLTEIFSRLITGYGWLVRRGQSNVNASQDLTYEPNGFTLEKAPRDGVGVFQNGTMLLLEVDGEEDINYGPDLFEMAELLVDLGVDSAVNIDGGGSSVSVSKGKVIDLPTCNDTPEILDRFPTIQSASVRTNSSGALTF